MLGVDGQVGLLLAPRLLWWAALDVRHQSCCMESLLRLLVMLFNSVAEVGTMVMGERGGRERLNIWPKFTLLVILQNEAGEYVDMNIPR